MVNQVRMYYIESLHMFSHLLQVGLAVDDAKSIQERAKSRKIEIKVLFA